MALLCNHWRILYVTVVMGVLASGQPILSAEGQDSAPATQQAVAQTQPVANNGLAFKQTSPLGESPIWQMLGSLLLVMALLAVCWVVIRKVLPRITRGGGRHLKVLDTVCLGPHKTVYLIQVGNRKVLVGGSRDRLTMLTTVDDAFENDPSFEATIQKAQESQDGPTSGAQA